jgi:hypothetical protein
MRGAVVLLLVVLMASGCATLKSSGQKEKPSLPEGQYLEVISVQEKTEAARVGIKEGDVLLSYDGQAVASVAQLNALKDAAKADPVQIVVLRGDEKKTFEVSKGQIGLYLRERMPETELAADAVVLKGVNRLGWDTGMPNSFLAALTAAANYMGIDKDYTYLNGVSGAAFRIQFFKDWCPSSPDPTCGFDAGAEAMKALGFDFQYLILADSAKVPGTGTSKDDMTKAVMASIDAGKPAIAIDLIQIPEWGVITGYQKGGSELLCRTYFDKTQGYSIAEKFPWVVVIIKDKKAMPSDRGNYMNAFKIALKEAVTDSFGDYYSGTKALEKWIDRLKMDNFADMAPDRFETCCLANAWIYERMGDDRTYGYKFLDALAVSYPEFGKPLGELSAIYKSQVEILKSKAENAPFPAALAPGEAWTGDMRAEEVGALQKVLEKEYEAVKILTEINAKL